MYHWHQCTAQVSNRCRVRRDAENLCDISALDVTRDRICVYKKLATKIPPRSNLLFLLGSWLTIPVMQHCGLAAILLVIDLLKRYFIFFLCVVFALAERKNDTQIIWHIPCCRSPDGAKRDTSSKT